MQTATGYSLDDLFPVIRRLAKILLRISGLKHRVTPQSFVPIGKSGVDGLNYMC